MKGDQLKLLMPHRSTGYVVGARYWRVEQYVEASRFMPQLSITKVWNASEAMEETALYISTSSTFRLRSISANYKWPKDEPARADTPIKSEIYGIPLDWHALGIFAFTVREFIRRVINRRQAARLGDVAGLVALWGDVVEHSRGFRASHAYPLCLDSPLVAKDYKVPYLQTHEWSGYLNSNKEKHLNDPTTL